MLEIEIIILPVVANDNYINYTPRLVVVAENTLPVSLTSHHDAPLAS